MKNLIGLLLVIIIAGCKLRPDEGIINTAAIHFSGVFITQNISSVTTLHVRGKTVVKSDTDNIYHVGGTIEGYSSFNAPVSIAHFTETLHYSGGNPNEQANWKCIDIYIADKKLK